MAASSPLPAALPVGEFKNGRPRWLALSGGLFLIQLSEEEIADLFRDEDEPATDAHVVLESCLRHSGYFERIQAERAAAAHAEHEIRDERAAAVREVMDSPASPEAKNEALMALRERWLDG